MRHRENDCVEVSDGAQLTLLDRDLKGNSKAQIALQNRAAVDGNEDVKLSKSTQILNRHLVKVDYICKRLSISRATVYRLMKQADNPFPAPIKIGKSSLWVWNEVEAWVQRQADNRARL